MVLVEDGNFLLADNYLLNLPPQTVFSPFGLNEVVQWFSHTSHQFCLWSFWSWLCVYEAGLLCGCQLGLTDATGNRGPPVSSFDWVNPRRGRSSGGANVDNSHTLLSSSVQVQESGASLIHPDSSSSEIRLFTLFSLFMRKTSPMVSCIAGFTYSLFNCSLSKAEGLTLWSVSKKLKYIFVLIMLF
jgi:hypothetical protein